MLLLDSVMNIGDVVNKILVVDDVPVNRLLLDCYLKQVPKVESVSSGEDAVSATKREKYDLILMDIDLGKGICGQEATRRIHKSLLNKNTPVVAVTSYPKSSLNMELFDDYISKPVYRDVLFNKINSLISKG